MHEEDYEPTTPYRDHRGIVEGQIRFGQLREALSLNSTLRVIWQVEDLSLYLTPRRQISGELGSYRGYYSDVAIELHDDEFSRAATEAQLLESVLSLQKQGFMVGHKGGFFEVHSDCPVWIAIPGDPSRIALVRIERLSNAFLLECTTEGRVRV